MSAADLLIEELQTRGVPFLATLNDHALNCCTWPAARPTLREALAADRPTVIHVPIVPGSPAD